MVLLCMDLVLFWLMRQKAWTPRCDSSGELRSPCKPRSSTSCLKQHLTTLLQLLYHSNLYNSPNKYQQTCLTPDARIGLPRLRRSSPPTRPSPPRTRSRKPSLTPVIASPVALSPTRTSPPLRRRSTRPSVPRTTTMAAPASQLVTRSRTLLVSVTTKPELGGSSVTVSSWILL